MKEEKYTVRNKERKRERESIAEAIIENVADETVARQQRATVRYIYGRITMEALEHLGSFFTI